MMSINSFSSLLARQVGPREQEINQMLKTIGVPSLNALIDETIPASIRLQKELNLPDGISEYQYLHHIKKVATKNKVFRTYIGLGYYNTITPSVIQRNIFENPSWYTPYTPYQAEISQGRLEALLNFQTAICDLTGMEVSNASLLDEATAGAEAMIMMFNLRSKEKIKAGANQLFVSTEVFPQTIDVLKTRSEPLGIELIFGSPVADETIQFLTLRDTQEKIFGALIQYPSSNGEIYNYTDFVKKVHEVGGLVAVAADILGLVLLTPPGEWGADIVFGSTQRLGIPMGFGGPSAAYFASKKQFIRNIPGRIIGVSIDKYGNPALRMMLQTREQHIKRERATSNICTAQVLPAIMAAMYCVYHGPNGLKHIATKINNLASILNHSLLKLGYSQNNKFFFDTLNISLPDGIYSKDIEKLALEKQINFRYIDNKTIGISIDETTELADINDIIEIFTLSVNKQFSSSIQYPVSSIQYPISNIQYPTSNIQYPTSNIQHPKSIPPDLKRTSDFLTHPVFNTHHSEISLMRYIKKLENKDIALNYSMIPLGSCTMKLTSAVEMFPLSWAEFASIHPFVPKEQALGYYEMHEELEKFLSEITGLAKVSFQPNSGAAGEYAGLMVIRAYHKSRGEVHRNVVLIPASAHGTNPASCAMVGMKIVVVKCDERGNIDVADVNEKAEENKDKLCAIMLTYPSTHGVFEEEIKTIIDIVHENGGQVYMDGANMNAMVGYTNPGILGADVCHLNLHKTFGSPHGGGGPGMGPIVVAKHLVPFIPNHPIIKTSGEKGITAVSSSPFGSPLISLISYGYIKLLGKDGLKKVTEIAILNANYIKSKLEPYYRILYTGKNNRVAHEFILDCNPFKKIANVEVIDIAKRLIDYGFHAPTVAFPVPGTLMIEPTESEPLSELDRFCEAMIQIRKEIDEIAEGKQDKEINVLKNSPHTLQIVTTEEWNKPYSREKSAYPVDSLKENKYWPSVSRIDDAYGDRNLVCRWEA